MPNHNPPKEKILSIIIWPFLGRLRKSEKFSEIKPPLTAWFILETRNSNEYLNKKEQFQSKNILRLKLHTL